MHGCEQSQDDEKDGSSFQKLRDGDYTNDFSDAVLAGDKRSVSMCFVKGQYFSRKEALKVARRREVKIGRSLRCYVCPYCGCWHLTSKTEEFEPQAA